MHVIRCEGNGDKVKYGALWCGDNQDAAVLKAAAGALAKRRSANTPRYQKVFDAKQWTDCLLSVLANLDYEIVLRGTGVVQNRLNSCKETVEAVLKTQVPQALVLTANLDSGTAVPSNGLKQIKTMAGASPVPSCDWPSLKIY